MEFCVDWRKLAKSWNSSVWLLELGSICSLSIVLVAVSSDDEAAERWLGDLHGVCEGKRPGKEKASDNPRRERRKAAHAASGSRADVALMVAV